MWWEGNNETRYKYLYSPAEIDELAGRVKQAAGQTRLLFAFFNNHWQAYAPRNAVQLTGKLGLSAKEIPVQDNFLDDPEAWNNREMISGIFSQSKLKLLQL